MPKRRTDADNRRFFDEFASVRVSRSRASGVIDPAKRHAVISFGDKQKRIGTAHVRFPNGGGWSYFICGKCARLAQKLYSIDDRPLCWRCCDAMNIKHRSRYGFGRQERMRAADLHLDQLIAKLETRKPLRLNGAPATWQGKAKLVYRSRRLTMRMRRSMIVLRLHQLASQQANDSGGLTHSRLHASQGRTGGDSESSSKSGEPTRPNPLNTPSTTLKSLSWRLSNPTT